MKLNTISHNALPNFLCFLLCLLVFSSTYHSTKDLTTPADSDNYRDMGVAQAALDGLSNQDAIYLNETPWYTPLTPLIAATYSKVSGLSLSEIYTHAGVYLNIFGPICFYILVATVFGRWPALVALFSYLFLYRYSCEVWHNATYSPWLWPLNFTQSFTFLCLASLWKSLSSNLLRWHLICGILLGVTFISHPAPAVIIAFMILLITGINLFKSKTLSTHSERFSPIIRLLIIGMISFAIASPFLIPIATQYHFKVLNPAPMQYIHLYPSHVIRDFLTFRSLPALAGAVFLLLNYKQARFEPLQRLFTLSLIGVTGVFLVYAMIAVFIEPRLHISLPRLFPSFHFHLYFTAWESLLFGIGLIQLIKLIGQRLGQRLGQRFHFLSDPNSDQRRTSIVVTGFLALLLFILYPDYSHRHDLVEYVNRSHKLSNDQSMIDLYQWTLTHLSPDDVVLTEENIGIYAIGAAGRKIIATNPVYSNPYVDVQSRIKDRNSMFRALQEGKTEKFFQLAQRYALGYIAVDQEAKASTGSEEQCCWLAKDVYNLPLNLIFESGKIRLYQILLPKQISSTLTSRTDV